MTSSGAYGAYAEWATYVQMCDFLTIVVGPNDLFREGLVSILRAAGFRMLDSACSVSDLDMSVLSQQQVSVLMILIADGDSSAIVKQIELFKDYHKNGNVVIVADSFRLSDVISAFQHGTQAYFMKDASSAIFIKYLELVIMGETIVPQEILLSMGCKDDYQDKNEIKVNGRYARMNTENNHVCENNHAPHLSCREKAILRFLVSGDSNKAIARKMDIAEATVKVYIKTILRKVRVQNRTQAAIWAIKNDFLIFAVDMSSKTSATMDAAPPSG